MFLDIGQNVDAAFVCIFAHAVVEPYKDYRKMKLEKQSMQSSVSAAPSLWKLLLPFHSALRSSKAGDKCSG